MGLLTAETHPIIHAKSLIVRILDVVPAVQSCGIRIRLAQFLPKRIFLWTVEVTEPPGLKAIGPGRRLAPLQRGWGTLNRADKGYDSKAKKE